jgi:hypothetical protein
MQRKEISSMDSDKPQSVFSGRDKPMSKKIKRLNMWQITAIGLGIALAACVVVFGVLYNNMKESKDNQIAQLDDDKGELEKQVEVMHELTRDNDSLKRDMYELLGLVEHGALLAVCVGDYTFTSTCTSENLTFMRGAMSFFNSRDVDSWLEYKKQFVQKYDVS